MPEAPQGCRGAARSVLAPLLIALAAWASSQAVAQPTGAGSTNPGESAGAMVGSPMRLRQPDSEVTATQQPATSAPAVQSQFLSATARTGEFETFVGLPRFGADLVNELVVGAADNSPEVPADYLIQQGDEILVTVWGSIDADLRLMVDRGGRISVPRVGPVMVSGLRYDELQPALARRMAQTFKNFEVSASLGRLRGVRVFVTGFVQRPGAYVVGGLSTVVSAIMRAGGPGVAGSYRGIELRRGGKTTTMLDLYDLMLRGDRSGDRVVHPDDVIHVLPVGKLVGVHGSVNNQAVFELKPTETVRDVLRMAGGLTAVADRTRAALERLDERNGQRLVQVAMPEADSMTPANGDVLRIFSAVGATLSVERQNRRVKVEGEVGKPGEYLLPPGSTISAAIAAAGGLTKSAHVYGLQFTRESVRLIQAENYDRALRDLETDFIRNTAGKRVATADEGASMTAQTATTSRLIERLRALKPSGRVVLELPPDGKTLPDLLLEDQDRIYVPAQPTSVGVFGSVFNAGSYLFSPGRTVAEYLRLAGGPTKGGDEASIFMVRANGQVVSSRQNSGLFSIGNQIAGLRTEPGDTLFVPEELDRSSFLQSARDVTLLLFQLGVGSAGIKAALN